MVLSGSQERLDAVLAWVDAHRDEALADLMRFCCQPSVAAQDWGMEEMAAMVMEALRGLGARPVLVPTSGYPVVAGRLEGAPGRRLAIYNHYDVQPPEPLDAWTSPPFEATIRDGRLFARGVADNKGNLVARLWAVRAWREVHGMLPCTVTFLVEGEEEIGSLHLAEFAAAHQDLIQADACLWEAGYREPDGPLAFYAGVKGILYVELRVRGVAYDLHSSNAPLAPNAAWRLVEALNSLHEPSGKVRIPHFYDAVRPATEREQALMAQFPVNAESLRHLWQVAHLLGPEEHPAALTERLLFEPTCNICGLWSGYSGPGSKTVLPATAAAKLDFRLVPDQEPETVLALLRRYLNEQGFSDIEVVEMGDAERPAQSPVDTPLMEALVRSARLVYGIEPRVLPRMAGTGPMEQLCLRYGVPAVGGAGVGYAGSRNHAPNENIVVEDFFLGIKHVAALLADFASV